MDLEWKEFYTANSTHMDDPNLYWEAGKAYLRGRDISYAAAYKKNTQNSPENRAEWQVAKRAFDSWADTLELAKRANIDATLHRYGNKAGKFGGPHHPTHITLLGDSSGTTIPQEVSKAILKFYSSQNACDPVDKSIAHSFLDKVHLPTVSPIPTPDPKCTYTYVRTLHDHTSFSPQQGPWPWQVHR